MNALIALTLISTPISTERLFHWHAGVQSVQYPGNALIPSNSCQPHSCIVRLINKTFYTLHGAIDVYEIIRNSIMVRTEWVSRQHRPPTHANATQIMLLISLATDLINIMEFRCPLCDNIEFKITKSGCAVKKSQPVVSGFWPTWAHQQVDYVTIESRHNHFT